MFNKQKAREKHTRDKTNHTAYGYVASVGVKARQVVRHDRARGITSQIGGNKLNFKVLFRLALAPGE